MVDKMLAIPSCWQEVMSKLSQPISTVLRDSHDIPGLTESKNETNRKRRKKKILNKHIQSITFFFRFFVNCSRFIYAHHQTK